MRVLKQAVYVKQSQGAQTIAGRNEFRPQS
jgi:hypothetical protein